MWTNTAGRRPLGWLPTGGGPGANSPGTAARPKPHPHTPLQHPDPRACSSCCRRSRRSCSRCAARRRCCRAWRTSTRRAAHGRMRGGGWAHGRMGAWAHGRRGACGPARGTRAPRCGWRRAAAGLLVTLGRCQRRMRAPPSPTAQGGDGGGCHLRPRVRRRRGARRGRRGHRRRGRRRGARSRGGGGGGARRLQRRRLTWRWRAPRASRVRGGGRAGSRAARARGRAAWLGRRCLCAARRGSRLHLGSQRKHALPAPTPRPQPPTSTCTPSSGRRCTRWCCGCCSRRARAARARSRAPRTRSWRRCWSRRCGRSPRGRCAPSDCAARARAHGTASRPLHGAAKQLCKYSRPAARPLPPQPVTGQLAVAVSTGAAPPPIWELYGHLWRALLLGRGLPASVAGARARARVCVRAHTCVCFGCGDMFRAAVCAAGRWTSTASTHTCRRHAPL